MSEISPVPVVTYHSEYGTQPNIRIPSIRCLLLLTWLKENSGVTVEEMMVTRLYTPMRGYQMVVKKLLQRGYLHRVVEVHPKDKYFLYFLTSKAEEELELFNRFRKWVKK